LEEEKTSSFLYNPFWVDTRTSFDNIEIFSDKDERNVNL